jgi:hypothetical protein
VIASQASLAVNVEVAEPTMTGRVIAAWPSLSLIASHELLVRQMQRVVVAGSSEQSESRPRSRLPGALANGQTGIQRPHASSRGSAVRGREAQVVAWQWAMVNRSEDGSLPPAGTSVGSMADMSDGAGRSSVGTGWRARPAY